MDKKTETPPAEKTPKNEKQKMRALTEEEIAIMHGDTDLPEGYSNTTLTPGEESTTVLPEKLIVTATPPAPPEPVTTILPSPQPEPDTLEKLERELQKPEGKADLSKFSPREKAYFHQMQRDRRAKQKAEAERDVAFRKLNQALNPPPPPPDPFSE